MLTVRFFVTGLISSFVSTVIVRDWILMNCLLMGSQDIIVAITTRPEAGRSGVPFRQGRFFSPPQRPEGVRILSSPFYSTGARGSSHWGIKRPGWKADPSLPPSAKVKNGRARCSPVCLHGLHTDILTFSCYTALLS